MVNSFIENEAEVEEVVVDVTEETITVAPSNKVAIQALLSKIQN